MENNKTDNEKVTEFLALLTDLVTKIRRLEETTEKLVRALDELEKIVKEMENGKG